MFQFARSANNCAFSVTLDQGRITAQQPNQPRRHLKTQRLEVFHKGLNIFGKGASKRIFNHGNNRGAAQRGVSLRPPLVIDLFGATDDFSNLNFRHIPHSFQVD